MQQLCKEEKKCWIVVRGAGPFPFHFRDIKSVFSIVSVFLFLSCLFALPGCGVGVLSTMLSDCFGSYHCIWCFESNHLILRVRHSPFAIHGKKRGTYRTSASIDKIKVTFHRANGTKKNRSWKLRLSLQTASLYSYFTNEMTEAYGVSRICLRLCHILSFWLLVSWVPGHQVGPLFHSDLSIHWYLRHKMWNTKYSHTWGLLWAVFHLSIVVFKISILFCPEIKRTNAQYYMIPFLKLHESLEMI